MFGYVFRCQVICIALYKFVGNLDSFFGSVNAIAYRTLIFLPLFILERGELVH